MARKQKLIDKLKEEKFSSVINAILKYGLTLHKTFASMVGDNADRLQYKLDLENNRFELDEGRKEEYQKAILWLLNTFLFYPRELGLVDEPRKQR